MLYGYVTVSCSGDGEVCLIATRLGNAAASACRSCRASRTSCRACRNVAYTCRPAAYHAYDVAETRRHAVRPLRVAKQRLRTQQHMRTSCRVSARTRGLASALRLLSACCAARTRTYGLGEGRRQERNAISVNKISWHAYAHALTAATAAPQRAQKARASARRSCCGAAGEAPRWHASRRTSQLPRACAWTRRRLAAWLARHGSLIAAYVHRAVALAGGCNNILQAR